MSSNRFLRAAYAYLYIHDFTKAYEAFQQAIATDPANPACYFHASVTAHRNHDFVSAREWAQQAFQLEPSNALYAQHWDVVRSAIAVSAGHRAYACGDTQLARNYYAEALVLDPLSLDAETALQALDSANPVSL